MPGVPERRTHSYVRHGTTSGSSAEFLHFLKEIDAKVPEGLDIHIVIDNYATHKTPQDQGVARPPAALSSPLHADFGVMVRSSAGLPSSPESGSVEVFIPLQRQPEADIRAFIDWHNQNPRLFKWTKSADQILASVKRICHNAQQTLCGEL
jgi:hypothetical protein